MLLLPAPHPLLLETLKRWERRELLDLIAQKNAYNLFQREHGIHAAINGAYRQKVGASNITFKASGGTAAITLASLATTSSDSTGAQQSVKADFQVLGSGSDTAAQWYEVRSIFSWVTTAPTAQLSVDMWANPSSSATAGTDNVGGCAGTNSAYTGNLSGGSGDISVATGQMTFIGSFIVSAIAADQNGIQGYYRPSQRYGSIVVWNRSGRLLNATEGNMGVTFTPLIPTSDAS